MPNPPTIEYASPRNAPPPPRWLLKVAVACGAIPLVLGVGATLFYALTRWDFLTDAVILLLIGPILFVVGTGCLSVFGFYNRRLPESERREHDGRRVGWTLALLCVNWPAALACLILAAVVNGGASRGLDLTVTNRRAVPVGPVDVTAGGRTFHFDTVTPGSTLDPSMRINVENGFVVQAGGSSPETFRGFDEDDLSGQKTLKLIFSADGSTDFYFDR